MSDTVTQESTKERANELSREYLNHLKQIEAESIQIIREVAAEFEHPVMLYSIGKDSPVVLHPAMKAFYPGKPPFPLMHVDTTWKFRDMIQFRDQMIDDLGLELIVHINQEGIKQSVGSFSHYRENIPIVPVCPFPVCPFSHFV